MSQPIGPGDWIEWVGPSNPPWTPPTKLWVCEAVIAAPRPCPACGATELIKAQGFPFYYCASMWRTTYRPKAELISSLLAPTDLVVA